MHYTYPVTVSIVPPVPHPHFWSREMSDTEKTGGEKETEHP